MFQDALTLPCGQVLPIFGLEDSGHVLHFIRYAIYDHFNMSTTTAWVRKIKNGEIWFLNAPNMGVTLLVSFLWPMQLTWTYLNSRSVKVEPSYMVGFESKQEIWMRTSLLYYMYYYITSLKHTWTCFFLITKYILSPISFSYIPSSDTTFYLPSSLPLVLQL